MIGEAIPLCTHPEVSFTERPPVIGRLLGAGTPNVVITWNSFANQTYRVQYVTDLATTNWFNLVPDVTATGSTASFTDHPAGGREVLAVEGYIPHDAIFFDPHEAGERVAAHAEAIQAPQQRPPPGQGAELRRDGLPGLVRLPAKGFVYEPGDIPQVAADVQPPQSAEWRPAQRG